MRTATPSFAQPPRSSALSATGPERVPAVGAGDLAAQPRRRHDLAGVREPARVEGAAQHLERREVGLLEHLRHVALLVDADAVLAGDRPARVDARLDDPPRQLLGALRLLRAGVEEERVEVAVEHL